MALNFDAQVRLTEALLPLLRESAPSAIVNVASTAARVAQAGERRVLGEQGGARRVVGRRSPPRSARTACTSASSCPGFIATEGFPAQRAAGQAAHALGGRPSPSSAAEAIRDAGLRGRHERFVPRGLRHRRDPAHARARDSSAACSAEGPVRCSPPAPHPTTTVRDTVRAPGR